ncbi:phage holin family protein [Sphingobacterium pedocola]|uniref:phage holin family protein n=1 Tax=Sphingobacterium pedocola TaxID=2082722 RepID=UPI0018CB0A35|nr:phage holin family protein [Sphingobacterium pedocola]
MEEQKFSFSGSFQKIQEYVDTRIDLIKLKVVSRSSRIIGALIVDVSKLVLLLIIIFFFSLALGFYLGELLGSYSLGFLATGGIFLVLLLMIKFFEPKLEAKLMDITIQKVMGKWKEDDEYFEGEDTDQDLADLAEKVEDDVKEIIKKDLNHEYENK